MLWLFFRLLFYKYQNTKREREPKISKIAASVFYSSSRSPRLFAENEKFVIYHDNW